MSKILIFTESNENSLKRGTLELLTAARKSGGDIHAVVLGSNANELVAELGKNGAKNVHVCDSLDFNQYNPQAFAQAMEKIIGEINPEIILASASMLSRDLFPRVAAKLGAGVASDCTELNIEGNSITVRKPLYAGKCSAQVNFKSDLKIALMRPNQLPVEEGSESEPATVHKHDFSPTDLKTLVKDIVKGTSEKLDLTEANIIVAGGRGLKEADNFKLLEGLADTLGATVGASRAVVDAGWVPHSMQVGQTGKTVAPSLYIAVGISGAIQHLAGMNGSKVIVAINNDPEAPIFQKSTYGIVGDLFEVIPALNEEFKKIL